MSLRSFRTIGPAFPHLASPLVAAVVTGFDADTTAWIAQVVGAGNTVSASQQTFVNNLVVALKASGSPSLWSKCDGLWLLGGEVQQYQARINLKNPPATVATLVAPSTLTIRGYHGDGATGSFDTKLDLSTGGLNYTTNSASFGIFASEIDNKGLTFTDAQHQGATDGTYVADIQLAPAATYHVVNIQVNNSGPTHSVNLTGADVGDFGLRAFWLASRTSSTAVALYKNGVSKDSWTDTATGVPATSPAVYARHLGGSSYDNWSLNRTSLVWIGGGLNATEAANLSTIILAYLGNHHIGLTCNMLSGTQDFAGSSWTHPGPLTVTSADTLGPDGFRMADLLMPVGGPTFQYITQTGIGSTAQAYTYSVYAKAKGTWQWLRMTMFDGSVNVDVWFDLINHTNGTIGSGATVAVTAAGNGFYRYSMTVTMTTITVAYLLLADADNNSNGTGSGTSGVWVWGAQYEPGSSATTYSYME